MNANPLNYLTAGKESRQSVSTPPELVAYVKARWPIAVDLAADGENAICAQYIDEAMDSLRCPWLERLHLTRAAQCLAWPRPVGWLNPPFGKTAAFMAKSRHEALRGAHTVSLVPASVESGWFAEHIYLGPCTVHVLKGRLKFPGYANVAGQGHMLVSWHGGEWGGIHVLDWKAATLPTPSAL